jgi:hypothetical protein
VSQNRRPDTSTELLWKPQILFRKPNDSAIKKRTYINRYLGTKNYHPSGPHNGNWLIIICDAHVNLILELNNNNNMMTTMTAIIQIVSAIK